MRTLRMIRLVSWAAVGVLTVAFVAYAGWRWYAGAVAPIEFVAGQAPAPAVEIGGPFTLTDQHGRRVSDTDFRGRYMLIYFGYTYCPDVCPTALAAMTQALEMLGDDAERIQPIFITIDPKRDTVEQLARYAPFFDPRLEALTGTDEEIAAAAKAYRVYYKTYDGDGESGDDDYAVDHSSFIYLMGPDGKYRAAFMHGASAEEMAAAIRRYL